MANGTGIYVPPEMLGDGTADSTKFLRGDSTWAETPTREFSPSELVDLLTYAYQRIRFLEAALNVKYKNELPVPDAYSLIQEKIEWI